MPILLTGAAGFIGMHTGLKLLDAGHEVVGVDNLDPYYDPALKADRLTELKRHPGKRFRFEQTDLSDRDATERLFKDVQPSHVIHLAAQPGVRFGIDHPRTYEKANLRGMLTILEGCRHGSVKHLIYASSSSVYGDTGPRPSRVQQNPVDHPISLYAATKKADELMAYTYASLYGLRSTGLRFFTVYGPWGRPDMATWTFTQRMLAGEPIDVYSEGHHNRDFTFISDIVEGVVRIFQRPIDISAGPPTRIYNIGHGEPVPLMEFIHTLEEALGLKADLRMLPKQPGDVADTHADVSALLRDYDWSPVVGIQEGLAQWVAWYRARYHA
jgi:UDP-glucuronate 4-epimerase